MKITYEMTPCSRCGGSGTMPYPGVYNGKCFKCHGKGEVMTRSGAAAWKRVQSVKAKHCTVAASSLSPGDRVLVNGRTHTLSEVKVKPGQGNGKSRMGVEGSENFSEFWNLGETTLIAKGYAMSGPMHREVTVPWTAETIRIAAAAVAKMKGATVHE